MPLDGDETRLCDLIAARRDDLLAQLTRDVAIPTGRGSDYTELTLANQGPGDAQAVIDSSNYDDSIMIEAGRKVTITKIFGPGGTMVTNESASSIIVITFRIRSTSSSR